jgi:hypothetical protein
MKFNQSLADHKILSLWDDYHKDDPESLSSTLFYFRLASDHAHLLDPTISATDQYESVKSLLIKSGRLTHRGD